MPKHGHQGTMAPATAQGTQTFAPPASGASLGSGVGGRSVFGDTMGFNRAPSMNAPDAARPVEAMAPAMNVPLTANANTADARNGSDRARSNGELSVGADWNGRPGEIAPATTESVVANGGTNHLRQTRAQPTPSALPIARAATAYCPARKDYERDERSRQSADRAAEAVHPDPRPMAPPSLSDVQAGIDRLRANGVNLPNARSVEPWNGEPSYGSFVDLGSDMVARHNGRGAYSVMDVQRDLGGVSPPIGQCAQLSADGQVQLAQIQPRGLERG
jgi:hypothetical protein